MKAFGRSRERKISRQTNAFPCLQKKSKTKHLGNTKLNLNLYQQNDKRVLCANGAQHDDVRSANGKKHMAQEDSHRHVKDFRIYW